MRFIFLLSLFILLHQNLFSQTGKISGRVFDAVNNEALPYANVSLLNTDFATTTEDDGTYLIQDVPVGVYALTVTYVGYTSVSVAEIRITEAIPLTMDFGMEPSQKILNEVVIQVSPFRKIEESPLSVNRIGIDEIKRNPGSNRDISKVIQSLPGVGSTVSFRNDILIRGGAPNENRFYIDGIEIPNINHFATQGSTGGPVGMLNPEMIRNVDFYASAFKASRGNALSSVFDFDFKDGRQDKIGGSFTLGASELGATLEGPLSQKGSFDFSYRRSYLQYLFQALDLPFLPTYNDVNLKLKFKLNKKTEITYLLIGALDDNVLNLKANETDYQKYILSNLPESSQWTYTNGIHLKRFHGNGSTSLVLSRNMIRYNSSKYKDNNSSIDANKILEYKSDESENKIRLERTIRIKNSKFNFGAQYEYAKYTTSTYNQVVTQSGYQEKNYTSLLSMHKYGMYAQYSQSFFEEKLGLTCGLRMDGNNFNSQMQNPLQQLSPRVAITYALPYDLSFNATVGRYYQLPPYTLLGYKDYSNTFINKNVSYISSDHYVAGLDYTGLSNAKISIEAFYKIYNRYPFLLQDSISLANLGGDFGVIGNQAASSDSKGRSQGIELMYQQKLYKGFYGILALTFFSSQFTDQQQRYISSAWDSRSIVSLTAGKKLKRNWEIGIKWRYSGGLPYTPYDLDASVTPAYWDVRQQGIYDYSQLNTRRNPATHAMDLRIDKKWFFKKFNFNLYFDIQNLYGFQSRSQAILNVRKDTADQPILNTATGKYDYYFIENTSGTRIPSLGVILEF